MCHSHIIDLTNLSPFHCQRYLQPVYVVFFPIQVCSIINPAQRTRVREANEHYLLFQFTLTYSMIPHYQEKIRCSLLRVSKTKES